MKRLAALMVAIVIIGGCSKEKTHDWYLQSVKGDTIILYHNGKKFVARCRGVKYAGQEKLFPGSCAYLVQHVGAVLTNGEGLSQVSRPVSDIIYWREN